MGTIGGFQGTLLRRGLRPHCPQPCHCPLFTGESPDYFPGGSEGTLQTRDRPETWPQASKFPPLTPRGGTQEGFLEEVTSELVVVKTEEEETGRWWRERYQQQGEAWAVLSMQGCGQRDCSIGEAGGPG